MASVSDTVKDDVVVLAGHEFKRVKNGLDEDQVKSFIDEIVKERNKLAQAQDHIVSLNRLAERTIVEADKLAVQIKAEATEQAKAESAAIIDKAKEQARQIAEKKIAEAVELANEKAGAIKAKAEQEAATLLENEKNKIHSELRNLVNQQFNYMLEELERLKQQAAAIQADFSTKLSEPKEGGRVADAAVRVERDVPVRAIVEESNAIVAEDSKKGFDERAEPGQAGTDVRERSFTLSDLLQVEEQPRLGEPQWEIEILPPFEIGRIMEVVSFLDRLPEVANTEMIVPQIDAPIILVFLHKPIDIVGVLQKIPAVSYAEEVTVTANMVPTNGKPRKVRISLSENKRP